jgi:hypothetical protein
MKKELRKKLWRIFWILFGIGVLCALIVVLYVFFKPHRNIAKEKPAYILSAEKIYNDFSTQEDSSNIKYNNKAIELNDKIVNISIKPNQAIITFINDMGVNCYFDSLTTAKLKDELLKLTVGDSVKLKGQCNGYDMMGVQLTSCVLLKD